MTQHPQLSADDVLRAFAMDFQPGTGVLQRYLAEYPEYSVALIDLSMELTREFDDNIPLGAAEFDLVAAGMARLRENAATLQSLEAAPAKVFTEAISALALPMQVGLAFRERRIEVETLPHRMATKMAEALRTSTETLLSYLALPAVAPMARARKSAVKPVAPEKVSFERVLQDAGVDEHSISNLLREE
ncbi:hypothetical protein AZSI13_30630 [Azospira sp. I13]|uniref:hypothetical protein n=1 Tax=Azospira sp. I13 TaxID=1765050 RepID=UPI000D454A46|nr:hypothetical protein [Azospira sp. I13]GBG03736.1 hypothetical protein AZSI13_30630 [Azospira sp. I13]